MSDACALHVFDTAAAADAYRAALRRAGRDPDAPFACAVLPVVATPVTAPGAVPIAGAPAPIGTRRVYPMAHARLVRALDWFAARGATVISLSVGPREPLADDDPLALAVAAVLARGIPVVVAAGNAGPAPDTLAALARLPGVVAVGALDLDGRLAERSSRGPVGGRGPTVVAAGMPHTVIVRDGWRVPEPATSFAAPKVAHAVAALVRLGELLVSAFDDAAHADDAHAARDASAGAPAVALPPVALPVAAVGDTGAEPAALPPLPDAVREHLAREGPLVRFPLDARERAWLAAVRALAAARGFLVPPDDGAARAARCAAVARAALAEAAVPLPGYAAHQVGLGRCDGAAVRALLHAMTPSRVLRLLAAATAATSPAATSPADALASVAHDRAVAAADAALGPLWDAAGAERVATFLLDGTQLLVARVA